MNFNNNLSYNVRVSKRKFNKFRFFSFLIILVVCTACVLFLFNTDLRKGIISIFSSSVSTKVSSNEIQIKDTVDISSTKTTDKSSFNSTSSTSISSIQEVKTITKDYSGLKSEITNYISAFEGHYGVYFIDLKNIGEFGINDLDIYIAASTVKVPINLYLFNKIKDGSINPNDTIVYNKKIDYERGTGYIQSKKNGTKFTIKELSKLSITVSDNIATNMLIRVLGKPNYKNFMRTSGGVVVTNENISCPKDMALYMKKVYEFQKNNKVLGDELINYFENTVFNDRLTKLLPKEVKVAHKIGNYWGDSWGIAYHDVGIIYSENDYVLAVMSKNIKNEAEGCDVIANISKKVYDYMTIKNP